VRSKILTSSGSPRNAFAVWCPVLPVSSWSRSYSSCILRKSHFQNNGTARTAMQTPTSKTRSSTSCTAFTLSFARSPAVATAVLGGLRHFHLPFAIIFYPFSLVPFFFSPFFSYSSATHACRGNIPSRLRHFKSSFSFRRRRCCCCVFLCEPRTEQLFFLSRPMSLYHLSVTLLVPLVA